MDYVDDRRPPGWSVLHPSALDLPEASTKSFMSVNLVLGGFYH